MKLFTCLITHVHSLAFRCKKKLAEELTKKGKTIKDLLNSKEMKIELCDDPVQLISGIAKFLKENSDHLYCQSEVGLHFLCFILYLIFCACLYEFKSQKMTSDSRSTSLYHYDL